MTHTDFGRTHTGHPIQTLSAALIEWLKLLRRRRHFNRLLDLDDHMLDDVGATRAEIKMVSKMPLSVDAATELRRISLERRRRIM